mmetsp:Transcript_51558/g.122643  ORF Transcript_51558/g.122643 Transcript_51558/m.122643 type:complete len:234 (-) Transcript_51558:34-735(-)
MESPSPEEQNQEEDNTRTAILAFWEAASQDHVSVSAALQERLRAARQWRASWGAGSVSPMVAAAAAEEGGGGRPEEVRSSQSSSKSSTQRAKATVAVKDVTLQAFLQRLAHEQTPLPPDVLARLLPIANRIAGNADREEYAVAAMRFALQAVSTSWPPVLRALQTVSTPRAARLECDEVVRQLKSMFTVIKGLARSVRLSRSNGCLVPVCRKLKVALDEALQPELRRRQSMAH